MKMKQSKSCGLSTSKRITEGRVKIQYRLMICSDSRKVWFLHRRCCVLSLVYFLALIGSIRCSFLPSVVIHADTSRKENSLLLPAHTRPMETTEEREGGPVWDPVAQIYVGGVVPENAEVAKMIGENHGCLRLFGYGSLCWNPGTGPLAHPTVTSKLGRARGYRRCWAQKSTDHRGCPQFPGIVCTLLKDEEVKQFRPLSYQEETLTEGLIYEVPPDLVAECLAELDFREKGGYARDIIHVVEDDSGEVVKALLYRGTPDNPAIWPRVLRDLPLAAAIMSVAVGPSGENHVYLHQLDAFLESSSSLAEAKFDDTLALARMTKILHEKAHLHFLFGAGSNQHNQLLLKGAAADLVNGQDAHQLNEMVLCINRNDSMDGAVDIFAGGGHSALLTKKGKLYLWGWNDNGQCGTSVSSPKTSEMPLPISSPLLDIVVESVALGFSHTLVIERDTGRLYAFGDNNRGQVEGSKALEHLSFRAIAAGLFHSAAITSDGKLVTFGCGKFGQCLDPSTTSPNPWTPDDGSRFVKVACGRRHTVALDNNGRVFSFGENKHGQLGRQVSNKKELDALPALIALGNDWDVKDISCGWSHTVVLATNAKGEVAVFGWGRNDKGQLGIAKSESGDSTAVGAPTRLFGALTEEIVSVACGSETSIIVDCRDRIWSCGWNEHGNLGSGSASDAVRELTEVSGAPVTITPGYTGEARFAVAAGGAHMLAMRVKRN